MKIINNEIHYTAREVGLLIERSHLTIHLWDKWSNILEERGEERLIPQPLKIGKQGTRYWRECDVEKFRTFAKSVKKGDLAEFTRAL